jgi:hypothetical protein
MPKQTFHVAPPDFASYLASLPSEGMTITPDDSSSGTAVGHSVTIRYFYSLPDQTLQLTGVDKPWLVSWDYIFGLISEHLTSAGE